MKELITSLVDNFNGFKISAGSTILGAIPSLTRATMDEWLFWFQIGAFTISMIVGVLTIIGWFRKQKRLNYEIRRHSNDRDRAGSDSV